MTDSNKSYGSIDSVNLSSNNKNSKHGYRMILITLIVLLVGVGGIVISQRQNLQQILKGNTDTSVTNGKPSEGGTKQSAPIEVPSSTIQDRRVAWLEVVSENSNTFGVGETKKLYIKGTSGETDVVGYDFLIAYDPTMLEIQSVTSAMQDFEIFKFDRGDHMTITGIKDFKKKEPVKFTGSTILEVVVKAKKQGRSTFSLNSAIGQEKTQMVDSQVKVIEPQIGSVQLITQ